MRREMNAALSRTSQVSSSHELRVHPASNRTRRLIAARRVHPSRQFRTAAFRHPNHHDERRLRGCPRALGRRYRARAHPAVRHRLPHLQRAVADAPRGRPAALRQRRRAPHPKLQAPERRAAPVAQVRAAVLRRRRREQALRRHACTLPAAHPSAGPRRVRAGRHSRRPRLGPTRGFSVLRRDGHSVRGPERGPGHHRPAQGGDAHGGLRVARPAGIGGLIG